MKQNSPVGKPLVGRLHHVQVAAPPDCEEPARWFYGEVLGLVEVAKPPNLVARGGAWFRGAGVEIHVGVEQEFRPARKAHMALESGDLDALRARLSALSVQTTEDEPLLGFRRYYANDPFGNRLEFLQPLAEGDESLPS